MPAAEIWSAGDTVKLKSGGPVMTVDHYYTTTDKPPLTVVCLWFDSNDALQSATFQQDTLEAATP